MSGSILQLESSAEVRAAVWAELRRVLREAKPMAKARRQCLYFVQAGRDGPIKIGIAEKPRSRLHALQSGNHVPLHLLGWSPPFEVAEALEAALHAMLRGDWILGEWFRPAPDVLAALYVCVRSEVWHETGHDPDPSKSPVPTEPSRSAISAARAAAGRAGGLRSAEARLASKQTAQPSKQTVEANGATPKQNPEATSGSSFGSGSGPDLEIREIPTENHHPKDLTGFRAGDVCFEEDDQFLDLPLEIRAAQITETPDLAKLHRPHLWPEVLDVVRAFVLATGIPRRVAAYDRDSGVRAVVDLLAVFEPEAILRAIPVATKTEFWLREPGRPLASLSVTVVEDALGRDAAAARAEVQRRRRIAGSVVPTKPTPKLMAASEYLSEAQHALARVNSA